MMNNILSAGIDLHPFVEKELLKIITAMPESMGVEEHLVRILNIMDTFDPRHFVLDAISACRRMGSEKAGFDFLVRLLAACKARGRQRGPEIEQDEPAAATPALGGWNL